MTRTARFVRFGAQTRNSTLSPPRTDAPNRSPHFCSVDLSDIRGALDLALNIYQHGNRQVRKGASDREGEVSVSRAPRQLLLPVNTSRYWPAGSCLRRMTSVSPQVSAPSGMDA